MTTPITGMSASVAIRPILCSQCQRGIVDTAVTETADELSTRNAPSARRF